MTEKLARRLSLYLVTEGHASPEKRELLEYGIFHIVSSTFHVLLLLITGLSFGVLPGIAAYCIFFCSLKRYIGGAHASTHWGCLCGFTIAALVGALIGRLLAGTSIAVYLPVAFSVVALLLILWRAPAVHPNAPRHAREKMQRFKRRAMVTVAMQLVVVCACAAFGLFTELCICGSFGSFCATVTLLMPIPQTTGKGGGKDEANL